LILLTTMDSTFASKNKKMLKDIGYKSLLARSSEESISLLEMNDEIKGNVTPFVYSPNLNY